MRERKSVKLRVDMNEDTKFKIIDQKPERDLIYCIWIKLVLLAGKVNKEGELHLSSSIPYTIETLAIEFNRDVNQVKLALNVFLELEMIEIVKHNIYKVKNFVKHQNIKVKEENKEADNQIKLENNIQDDSEVLNKKDEAQKTLERKIDINISEKEKNKKEKLKDNKIDKIKNQDIKECAVSFDMKNIVNKDVENIKQYDKKSIVKEESINRKEENLKTNFNTANDIEVVKPNIMMEDKKTSRNSKKKTEIFKDGFQDIKEKYVSETFEELGEFKERKGDKLLFKVDF